MRPFLRKLVLATALIASTGRAAVVLQVVLDVHNEPSATVKNVPADRSTQLEVTLADRTFVVRDGDRSTIYDFANRKRIETRESDRTRVDYSLYDTIGFRVLELQNRVAMQNMLIAAKVKDAPLDPIDLQQLFSLVDQPGTPLQVRDDGAERTYVHDATVLSRESAATTSVTPAQAKMFAQYVRYTVGGHPQILADLAGSDAIPAKLVLTEHDMVDRTVTISVASARMVDNATIDLSRYRPRSPEDDVDPLDRLLDRTVSLGPSEFDEAKRRNAESRAAAIRDGRAFEAFLASFAANQMTGGPLTMTPDEQAAFRSDASSMKFAAALGAKSKEQITAALPVIVALKSPASPQSYLLDVFEANDRRLLGDGKAGRALLMNALSVNPLLSGAWKDLGDTVLATFDMPRAWRCWDTGRRIAPTFANFEAVDRLERKLAADHPEYF